MSLIFLQRYNYNNNINVILCIFMWLCTIVIDSNNNKIYNKLMINEKKMLYIVMGVRRWHFSITYIDIFIIC